MFPFHKVWASDFMGIYDSFDLTVMCSAPEKKKSWEKYFPVRNFFFYKVDQ